MGSPVNAPPPNEQTYLWALEVAYNGEQWSAGGFNSTSTLVFDYSIVSTADYERSQEWGYFDVVRICLNFHLFSFIFDKSWLLLTASGADARPLDGQRQTVVHRPSDRRRGERIERQ
jgi:hypothetical protein